jgi:hypothetical protein
VSWEPLDVDPISETHGLISNILKFLQEKLGINGQQRVNSQTYEKHRVKSMASLSSTEASCNSKIGLICYDESLYAFIYGSHGVPDDASVLPWIAAVNFAIQEKNKGLPLHEWRAVIGQTSASNRLNQSLGNDHLIIGNLDLKSCKFSYEERISGSDMYSWSLFRWVPIVIRGCSLGHNWRAAEFLALKQVHRLCSLLSLETGHHWTLKDSPRPSAWGDADFPDETPLGLKKHVFESEELFNTVSTKNPINTARLARMWKKCEEQSDLIAPVEAYYQAGSLRDSHPSLALVGFVGAIEEVGKLLIKTDKPEKCPGCGKDKTGSSTKRFREALRLVLPDEKVNPVSNALYKWRSGTAHAGRTYSWESTFGRPETSIGHTVSPPELLFNVRGITYADELARDLLLILLDGQSATFATS